jgi:hypothetical protein
MLLPERSRVATFGPNACVEPARNGEPAAGIRAGVHAAWRAGPRRYPDDPVAAGTHYYAGFHVVPWRHATCTGRGGQPRYGRMSRAAN